MTTSEIYKALEARFGDHEEGTEIGDAIGSLVQGAHILYGLGDYSKAVQAMMLVRELVMDDINWKIQEEGYDSLNKKEKELHRTGF